MLTIGYKLINPGLGQGLGQGLLGLWLTMTAVVAIFQEALRDSGSYNQ